MIKKTPSLLILILLLIILSHSAFAQYMDHSRFRIFGAYTSEIESDDGIFNIFFNYRWSDMIEIHKSKDHNVFISLEAGTKLWLVFFPNLNIGPEFTYKRLYFRLTTGIGYAFVLLVSPYVIIPLNGIDFGYRSSQGVEYEMSIFQYKTAKNNTSYLINLGFGIPIF